MKTVALLMQSAANGGVQRVMINLARGMLQCGVRVDFLIADATGEMRDQIPVECCIYDFKKKSSRGDLKVFKSMPQIAEYMRRNPDNVIYAAPGLACTVLAFLKIFYPKVKIVLINDNKCSLLKTGGVYHKLVYYVNKFVYRFADEVVAAHTPAMLDIATNYYIHEDKLHVIYHPLIDMEVINATLPEVNHPFVQAKKDGYKLLLAVGRLVQEKAFDDLIDAFARVRKERKVKLLILGEGEQHDLLQEKIVQNELQEDVELFGYTDRVFSFMKSADLYVLSSRQEAFGNVLVEAIACGLPCVATDCISGGPMEIMTRSGIGPYGFLCEKNKISALAKAIDIALRLDYDEDLFTEKTQKFEIRCSAMRYLKLVGGI